MPSDRRSRPPRSSAHRLERLRGYTLKPAFNARRQAARQDSSEAGAAGKVPKANFALDCGWGRLIFSDTFNDPGELIEVLREERKDRRDIAVYVRDPHVLLADAPQEVFLDPSHTFRLNLAMAESSHTVSAGFLIRRLGLPSDAEGINRLYALRNMVPVPNEFLWQQRDARELIFFVVEDRISGEICGTAIGVDHYRAYHDLERGSSLWCLAVDPQARHPGIGQALVRHIAAWFKARGAAWLDLSVMHDNEQAIGLYEKLGFERVPFFSIKRKNPINETLFTGSEPEAGLNAYAGIIVTEARRRGILVDVMDTASGLFRLTHGGRSVACRESLSELTSAVALSICDDKRLTRRLVEAAGVVTPAAMELCDDEQADGSGESALDAFLAAHGQVVVKPARGEQGNGVSVGLESIVEVREAIARARQYDEQVLIEAMVSGDDMRLVVIDFLVVAAAVRRPATIMGDGKHTVRALIEYQSRRRAAATQGESCIPVDDVTEHLVSQAGYDMNSVLPEGESLQVRKTANLHTGGTIHDVTDKVHPALAEAAVKAARAINLPVAGIDLMVQDVGGPEYHFIEANERPGLANHEPQPVVERFMDLLFPLTRKSDPR